MGQGRKDRAPERIAGRRVAFAALWLAGCSSGLTAQNLPGDTDPAVDPDDTDLPGETDIAGPDTAETEDANTPPVADAGADQSADVGAVVNLDGAASVDPDGDALSYVWEFMDTPNGSFASVINDDRPDAQFYVDVEGVYTVRLRVSDGQAEASDEVEITAIVPNGAPEADAGFDQTVSVGDRVQLNGSNSADPDGDTLSFRWTIITRPNGSAAALDNPNNPLPGFVADAAGAYEIQLVVNDGRLDSSADAVRIVAQSVEDEDCLSCAAEAERRIKTRWSAGELAAGPGLVLLPLLALLFQRRR